MSTSTRTTRQGRKPKGSLARRRRTGDDRAPQRTRQFKRWIPTFGATVLSAYSRQLFKRDALGRVPMWSNARWWLLMAAVVHLTACGDGSSSSSGPSVNITDTLNKEGASWA